EEGDAEGAVEQYAEAQAIAPEDGRLLFNLGNALARAERLEEAAQAWQRAAELAEKGEDSLLARDAWYNRGVAAMEQGAFPQAAQAMAQALRFDPQDAEARRNLELALRQLPPPQQQPESGDSRERDQQQDESQPSRSSQQDPNQQQQDEQDAEQRQDPSQRERESDEQETPAPAEQDEPQRPSPQAPRGEAADDQNKQDDKQMAERLLDMLDQNERQALRRALRQRAHERKPREKDW
ncbi:MAG: tetratricopeptide repeat protein, partial [Acidobacteriota bacterium]